MTRLVKTYWGVLTMLLLAAVSFLSFSPENKPATETEPYQIEYPEYFGGRFTIPADNPTTKHGVFLGRMLFYEPLLSSNNKLSCSSCHQQALAFTDGRRFSPGVDGAMTRRSAMSLANLLWVRNFFWDGRSASLEEQALVPLADPHEMGQSLAISATKLRKTSVYPTLFQNAFGSSAINEPEITKALAQFERTLVSANSKYDQYLQEKYVLTERELNGMNLFMTAPQPEKGIRGANCGHCHGTPKLFKELFHNNGLDSVATDIGRMEFTRQETDRGRFRVATLRNIALTAPYMHDGRFETLQEVLDHYNDHIRPSATLSSFITGTSNEAGGKSLLLKEEEKNDIIAFLQLLTDSTFTHNPAFADPHKH